MGNQQSNKNKSLSEVINYVAANYILTQNFQDMERLADIKYCDDLVILTSKSTSFDSTSFLTSGQLESISDLASSANVLSLATSFAIL